MVVGQKCPSVGGLVYLKGDEQPPQLPVPGRPTVIEAWATWCGPCRMVFPHLTAVAQKHAAKGLVVVGITQETDTPQLRGFVSGQGDKMGYSVASSEQAMMTLGTFASIGGIPHAIVVDRTGTVLYSGHPMQPGFEQAVEQACARGPVTETREELSAMGVAALKKILRDRGVGFGDLLEKSEFVERILERCT